MYPFIRMFWQIWKYRKAPRLTIFDTHVSHHMCLPWDIDIWMELNNGRTLTLYDLGRIPMAYRVGLVDVLKRKRWGLTMAGASVRYRRRVRTFQTVEMHSRGAYWDDKFFYIEQSMWNKAGECTSHIVYRSAVTGKNGIVPPAQVIRELGVDEVSPPAPEWVKAWIDADTVRPWPPMQD
ncbi:acyl-CoA thioesterase [Roseovarius indicus]|jgi:acyl-CoA thioesterase FadM|uniref:acyl-CoA thioesterase n=1 Tax=Roseovarius indicus TaxID=540747 RepID=UPI0007D94737|nr:acyl-CoA thioesterase [Roseovarius indicus]OAO10279.1 thioeseterase [Roseovarius indicus]